MARGGVSIGGVLMTSAIGLLVISWVGLVIAAWFAREKGRRRIRRAAVLVAIVSIIAASVAVVRV